MRIDPRNPYAPSAAEAVQMLAHVWGTRLSKKQREIVDAVFAPDTTKVLVQSCTGAGKTKIAADVALTWLLQRPMRTVITVAPTHRQVEKLLWKELRITLSKAVKSKHHLGFHVPPKACEITLRDGWGAYGFASNDPVNFQGWHSVGGTLVIIDEAVGVPKEVCEALEATLTGTNDRILALCNPTLASGWFVDTAKKGGEGVVRIKISAFDTPNVKAKKEIVPGLITHKFVMDRRDKWGEHSALYRSRVLAEFPDSDDQALIPIGWIDAAIARYRQQYEAKEVADHKTATHGEKEAGLDIARMGSDSTVLAPITFAANKTVIHELIKVSKKDTMEVTGFAIAAMREHNISRLRVDADGLGVGVFDRLVEQGVDVTEIRGGLRASEPTRYTNARSEMMWNLRKLFDPNNPIPVMMAPNDEFLLHATSLLWKLTSIGQIKVESKDDYRERTKNASPDELDAVAYAAARGAGTVRGVEAAFL